MRRLDRICAVLLFSLMIGCGTQPDPAATPDTGRSQEHPSGVTASAATVPSADRAPTTVPRSEIPPTVQFPSRDGRRPVAYKYRIQLDSRCTAQTPDGQSNKINADTSLTYVWRWRGSEAELLLDSMDVRTTINGQPMMESTMNGSRFYLKQDGQTMDETYDNASPELKQVLQDCFRTPMCKVVVDDEGGELKRTITAGPAAQTVVNTGIISNARFFHAPFRHGKTTWEAPGEMAMGNGEYARGNLAYETTDQPVTSGDEPSNLVEVKVSGTLTGDTKRDVGDVKNVVYRVEGIEVYNKRLREWISGALTVRIAFDTHAMGQRVANSGTIRLAMKLVSAEELPSARVAEREPSVLK